MAREPRHGDRGAALLVVVLQLLVADQAQPRTDFFQSAHGAPQALGDVGLRAQPAHQVERVVELVAAGGAEFGGGVGDSEEEDGEARDEEIVEDGLLAAVDVRCAVDICEDADGVFCYFDDGVGKVEV